MNRKTREDHQEAERRQAMRDLTRAAHGGDAFDSAGGAFNAFQENTEREAWESDNKRPDTKSSKALSDNIARLGTWILRIFRMVR